MCCKFSVLLSRAKGLFHQSSEFLVIYLMSQKLFKSLFVLFSTVSVFYGVAWISK